VGVVLGGPLPSASGPSVHMGTTLILCGKLPRAAVRECVATNAVPQCTGDGAGEAGGVRRCPKEQGGVGEVGRLQTVQHDLSLPDRDQAARLGAPGFGERRHHHALVGGLLQEGRQVGVLYAASGRGALAVWMCPDQAGCALDPRVQRPGFPFPAVSDPTGAARPRLLPGSPGGGPRPALLWFRSLSAATGGREDGSEPPQLFLVDFSNLQQVPTL
jgi:hypothetical protein